MKSVLECLQENEQLSRVPAAQLQWMIDRAEIRHLEPGAPLFERAEPSMHLYILLEGGVRIWFEQGNTAREIGRLLPGEITGVLPYSRMQSATADGIAFVPTQVLALHREHFPDMIRSQQDLTEALVHVMMNRVRTFTTLQAQNEKLMALGKISATLAHELNNPASAVVRSANELERHLAYLPDNFKRVISIRMEDEQVDRVNELLFERIREAQPDRPRDSARRRQEEALCEWLEDKGFNDYDEYAELLGAYDFRVEDLELVETQTGERDLLPVLHWIINNLTTEKLVNEIQIASRRISELVGAVKNYSHMDSSHDRRPVDLHEGIRMTATILKGKFRHARVELVEQFDPNLPQVPAYPGELNQVWTNLIDNALDALEGRENARITVSTCRLGNTVEVRIEDNGPGIPPDVQQRIWEPFYTTKPAGKGTGLGLDVVRKIVDQHRATIALESEPGRTQFRLVFPVE